MPFLYTYAYLEAYSIQYDMRQYSYSIVSYSIVAKCIVHIVLSHIVLSHIVLSQNVLSHIVLSLIVLSMVKQIPSDHTIVAAKIIIDTFGLCTIFIQVLKIGAILY